MRRDLMNADRMQAVREAAREWLRVGWIDEPAFDAVKQMYPDDRVRTGLAFRILFFVMTFFAIMSSVGIVYSQVHSESAAATFALFVGVVCAATTQYLLHNMRRMQGGIEAAFSLAAVVNLTLGTALLVHESHWFTYRDAGLLTWLFVVMLSGCAGWFWGYWPYAVVSAFSLFSAIVGLRGGRLIWILLVPVLYRWLVIGCDSAQLSPSLRKAAAAFLAVCVLTFYAAGNIYLLDQNTTGFMLGIEGWNREFFPRWLSIGLTAAVPLAIFFAGVIKRRRLYLNVGLLLVSLSLITLRMYIHVAPPWIVLTGTGMLLFGAAAALRRWLESGPGGERAGFTAAPLLTDPGRRSVAEIAVTVSAMTPGPRAVAEKPSFRGGGGEFGGGGASGNF